MHVPIQHIIGTVALISLIITATLAYSIVSSSVQADLQKQQLQQITENTALSIVELVNLAKFSIYNYEPITKTINLPTDVAGATYTVQLIDATNEGRGYLVRAELATNQHINAESSLPLNYTSTSHITIDNSATTQTLQSGLDNTVIHYCNQVYGKPSTVIWAQASWNTADYASISDIRVGLGWI